MIEKGLVDPDFQKKMTQYIKEAAFDVALENNKKSLQKTFLAKKEMAQEYNLNKPQTLSSKQRPIPIWAIIAPLGFLIIFTIIFPPLLIITLPIIFFFVAIYSLVRKIMYKVEQRTGKSLDWILTENGKAVKNQSLELKSFMEKYPMIEDRLANELVGHAVAFGIGKQWMKKLSDNKSKTLLFLENLSTQGEILLNFMDLESFVKEFNQNNS